jgi:hypothetical protein
LTANVSQSTLVSGWAGDMAVVVAYQEQILTRIFREPVNCANERIQSA